MCQYGWNKSGGTLETCSILSFSQANVDFLCYYRYAATSLRVCNGESDDSVLTACRVALQESWYTDTGSPNFTRSPSTNSMNGTNSNPATTSRPVIYLSPAAPSHLRRWLSLNVISQVFFKNLFSCISFHWSSPAAFV